MQSMKFVKKNTTEKPQSFVEEKIKKKENKFTQSDFGGYQNAHGIHNKICIYCEKFYSPELFLNELDYCGHCWGWLNSDQVDIYCGECSGMNTMDEILNFLEITYPLHSPLKCNSKECIYNKITSDKEMLHYSLSIKLGFDESTIEKKDTKEIPKEKYTNIESIKVSVNSIDWETSFIEI